MVRLRIKFFSYLLLLGALGAATAAPAPEQLSFRVYYKGLLSAMQELPIAEARLVTEQADAGRTQVSTLSLSSAAHDVVDALYPIRYRLRSLFDLREGRLRATERYKQTREVKHDLAWVDDSAGRLHYLRADPDAGTPPASLPPALRPWLWGSDFQATDRPAVAVPGGLLDRLALVQALRRRIPGQGQTLSLPVTDGSKLYRYEVRLDGSEALQLGGQSHPAWRLRVDGYQRSGEGAEEPKHAPVFVWISRDARRVPLRFHMDHRVGGFTVEWSSSDLPVTVAMDTPIPAAGTFDDG